MKKNLFIIFSSLVILIATIVIMFFAFKTESGNGGNNHNNKHKKYELLKNENIKYKYVSNYDDYMEYVEEELISKSDYYETLKEKDFEDTAYILVIMPFDPCSESIKKSTIDLDGDVAKIYLDMKYGCGVCAPARRVLNFEVSKNPKDVKIYTREVSREHCDPNVAYKPIIYIYPTHDMDLNIKLGNASNLTYTYPKYDNNWYVHVDTTSNIYDYKTKKNYYALYWEGIDDYKLDMSKGFVVKGTDTVAFLEEKLAYLGLNEREINEFIIYWIDKLEGNNYNFISFRNIDAINASMPLEFSQNPDTLIRVWMDYKPLENYIEVEAQQLVKQERTGFTIVEWGGIKH